MMPEFIPREREHSDACPEKDTQRGPEYKVDGEVYQDVYCKNCGRVLEVKKIDTEDTE